MTNATQQHPPGFYAVSYRLVFVCLVLTLITLFMGGERQLVSAQTLPLLSADLHLSQYVHEAWQAEEGLPQNSIFTTLQTRDSYLWLGTQEGLVRFDGVTFTVFDKARVPALPSNEIRVLLEDRDGALWIGSNGGVTRYADDTFTNYTTADGLSSNLVRALYEDQEGTIWIGTVEGGLNRFDGTSFSHFTTEDGLSGNVVLTIVEDAGGSLWVGTEAGLSRFADDSLTSYMPADGLPGSPVWALHPAADGSLWVGSSGGLARLEGDIFTPITSEYGLCGNVVSFIREMKDATLWIGTFDGGVCRLRNDTFERFAEDEGLTHNRVRSIYPDREGSIWIGTEGGGLNRLRGGKFEPITSTQGLSSDVVFTVLEDRNGTLWVGTEGGGLNRIDAAGITSFTMEDGLLSPDVFALHEDRSSTLWLGMYNGGLCRHDAGRFSCYTTDDGLTSNNVYAILEDRAGTLWIGTEDGLNQYQDGIVSAYVPTDGEMQPSITALLEDRAGNLWVGGFEGLSKLRDDHATHFSTSDGLLSEIVLTLYEDRDGSLWVGTQEGGLCRMKDEHFACITTREGLFNDNVLQILEDDDGFFWLGSLKGISRVHKKDLHAVADGLSTKIEATVYDKYDGLRSAEMSGGTQPAAWRSRNGRLWFATIQGLASIDPAHIPTNTLPPPVMIESVDANGYPAALAVASGLELAPGSKDLTIQYTGLSYIAPDQVQFTYQLVGYDEAWVQAGTRREAYYTNLSPGSYTFRVRARNADGVWNETGASFSFVLKPYFFQTAWFLALCVLLLVALGFVAHRLRINQLKARERELEAQVSARTYDLQQEKEQTEEARQVIEAQAHKLRQLDHFKTRFFANISHEFRTPLTMILGPLENALHGSYGPIEGPLRRQVEIMLRNALRLTRLINQLLDLSKLEAGKMLLRAHPRQFGPFLEGIVLSCTAFAEQKDISLTAKVGQEPIELYFEPDKLEKVFFNLISNALKFTPAGGSVGLSATKCGPSDDYPDGTVEVLVTDTGSGIPAEHLSRIFDRFQQVDDANTRKHEGSGIGLSLAREIILLHYGTITVESEVGKGTTFLITLPLGKAHLQHEEVVTLLDDDPSTDERAMFELASAFEFAEEAAPLLGPEPASDKPLILIVDDNADVRDYIGTILASDYRLAQARHGQEGLEQAYVQHPDLILSDVMMPIMDGHAFCRAVKQDSQLNHIPVILLTAKASHQDKLEGLDDGADDFLAKPFNAQELQTRIRNLLQMRLQEKELKVLNEDLEAQVRHQLEVALEERERYEAELLDAKERAEASSRLKSAILNNMSHELRTPIAAMQGFGQLLADELGDPHQEFATYIVEHAHRLLDTLTSVFDLAQLESGEIVLKPAPITLATVVDEALHLHQDDAIAKGLQLHRQLPTTMPACLTDSEVLLRLLDLLIGNAVKYTERGEITLAVAGIKNQVVITVKDTGVGISDAFLPHLFDAFQQESVGLTREHEGSGLGLAIAKSLVEALQGTIRVTSQKGNGSTFKVMLPVSLVPARAVSPRGKRPIAT